MAYLRTFSKLNINIENNIPKEEIVNLLDLNREEALDSIRYSSLLPFNPKGTMGLHNQFINDLSQGLYNGYKLDGGLVNNTLIKPLLDKNFDKISSIGSECAKVNNIIYLPLNFKKNDGFLKTNKIASELTYW